MLDVIKLSPQQHYIDDHGTRVIIISVEEKRVVFMRDGYPHPCIRPMHNFLTKFKEISKNKSYTKCFQGDNENGVK